MATLADTMATNNRTNLLERSTSDGIIMGRRSLSLFLSRMIEEEGKDDDAAASVPSTRRSSSFLPNSSCSSTRSEECGKILRRLSMECSTLKENIERSVVSAKSSLQIHKDHIAKLKFDLIDVIVEHDESNKGDDDITLKKVNVRDIVEASRCDEGEAMIVETRQIISKWRTREAAKSKSKFSSLKQAEEMNMSKIAVNGSKNSLILIHEEPLMMKTFAKQYLLTSDDDEDDASLYTDAAVKSLPHSSMKNETATTSSVPVRECKLISTGTTPSLQCQDNQNNGTKPEPKKVTAVAA